MTGDVTVIYEWSDDGWWVAEIAEVPGAISQGRTKEEARDNVLEALHELLEARRDLAIRGARQPEDVETVRLAG
ncbi:MAG TPA: type II toxin-antitoxin system HicB family antitoxin [Fimbriimonadaceae bacterium]|nr:type II toxin-antitoxin system HicB family antitoxin [Fimbriimonadaceae bacterium]